MSKTAKYDYVFRFGGTGFLRVASTGGTPSGEILDMLSSVCAVPVTVQVEEPSRFTPDHADKSEARATEAERLLTEIFNIAERDTDANIVTAVSNLHDIEKLIRAFLDGAEPVDDWLPADPPPKDGVRVLAWVPPYGPSTAHLENGRWHCHSVLNKDAVPTHWKHARAPDAVTKEGGE